jgi:hypothetical protein
MAYIQGKGRSQGSLFPVVQTTLFLPIRCVASSMPLSQGLRCQSSVSSALKEQRQDDPAMIHA